MGLRTLHPEDQRHGHKPPHLVLTHTGDKGGRGRGEEQARSKEGIREEQ